MSHTSKTIRGMLLPIAFLAIAWGGPGAAGAQVPEGDPEAGRTIADTWCAECHAIEPQAAVTDVVPSFEVLAQERTSSQLAAFLTEPHGRMPPLALSRREIDDLVAYIRSLRPR